MGSTTGDRSLHGSEVLDNTARPVAARVRAALERDDDYATAGKPPCDRDDPAARELLVDELVHDALAALAEELWAVQVPAGDGSAPPGIRAIDGGFDVFVDDGTYARYRGGAGS